MNKNDLHIIIEQLSDFDKERLKAYIINLSLTDSLKTEYNQLHSSVGYHQENCIK